MKILVTLLAVALLLFGCAGYGSPGTPSAQPQAAAPAPTPAQAEGGSTVTVTIQNFVFSPPAVTVKAGDTVKWANQDSAPHTVTSSSGAFDSGTLQNGGSFSFTFKNTGTYDYGCSIHTGMKGKVIVE